jgi:chromosome partitioning protein
MRRIVFTNDKGGVGKTTTVANLAVGLARKGGKTLVIDMDPQADVTFTLLAQRPHEAAGGYIPPTTHSLLTGHYTLQQSMLEVPRYPGLFLIPANSDLADASLRLAQNPTRLKRILDELPPDDFDVILIDTGKGLDTLAVNSLAASEEVIVILTPGRLELDAIERMREHVQLVRNEVLQGADTPVIRGILLTLADPYSITRDTLARIRKLYPDQFLTSIIPKNNDLQKAVGRASSIFEVAPHSKGAEAYQKLMEELGL